MKRSLSRSYADFGGRKKAKRSSSRKARSTFASVPSSLPDRLTVKMRYVESVSLASAANHSYNWRLNSLFDPNITGTGHQPQGRDEYAGFYGRYIVHKTYVELSASTPGVSEWHVAACPSNNYAGVTAGSPEVAEESPLGQGKVFTYQNGAVVFFRGWIDLPKLVGRTKTQYLANSDEYGALISADPSESLAIAVRAAEVDAGSAILHFTIKMVLVVELHDRVQMAAS